MIQPSNGFSNRTAGKCRDVDFLLKGTLKGTLSNDNDYSRCSSERGVFYSNFKLFILLPLLHICCNLRSDDTNNTDSLLDQHRSTNMYDRPPTIMLEPLQKIFTKMPPFPFPLPQTLSSRSHAFNCFGTFETKHVLWRRPVIFDCPGRGPSSA